MGNCSSVEHEEEEDLPYRRETVRSTSNNIVELLANPQLLYFNHIMLVNDGNNYGGKIFMGHLSNKSVFLKMIHQQERKKMERELNVLSDLTHTNIAMILLKLDLEDSKCFIVTEDFGTNLRDSIGQADEMGKKDIMLQICSAVSYLQDNQIAHLEISPRNVFVNGFPERPVVKLINFHRAQKIENNSVPYEFNDYIEGYAAPEVCHSKNVFLSSDIYSLGCLFFFIVTNGFEMHQIEYKNHWGKIPARIKTIDSKSSFNVCCKNLIQSMLDFEPDKRLTINEVNNHPVFWDAVKTSRFIIELSTLTEKNGQFISILMKGSHRVIDGDWTQKLKKEVVQTLQETRQAYQQKTGVDQDEINSKNIVSLVRTMRNHLAHTRNDKLIAVMGDNDESFMKYWNDRFPLLINHLHKSKIEYETFLVKLRRVNC